MKAKLPSHPNFGRKLKLEQKGKDVILTLESSTQGQAISLFENLLGQLKEGKLTLTLTGTPTAIIEH